ncbi:MAG: CehA/McbA family metallohydrolase [Treponema sp.]|jgi:hypothetical protein|nr:CehA/McbA family metallohydrolase [Treponema sp.]
MYIDFQGRRWYQGNLHAHTNRSDGDVSFEEAVARYKHAGYDFLSITDHWVLSENVQEENFLLLSGCEYGVSHDEPIRGINRMMQIHINGIGFTMPPKVKESPDLQGQAIIDAIVEAKGIAIFNHPAYSRSFPSDIYNLKGLSGMEIFNTLCGFRDRPMDYSGFYTDQLALGGINLPVFASDDAHMYIGEECRSFIMVQAENLTREAILDAIGKGRFFASQGPWVQVESRDRCLRVSCTPVLEIRIYSNKPGCWCLRDKNPFTGVEYTLSDSAYYYRVEVTDAQGNHAWTSPVKI